MPELKVKHRPDGCPASYHPVGFIKWPSEAEEGKLNPNLGLTQIAKIIGISRQKMNRLVAEGKFPEPDGGAGTRRLWSLQQAQDAIIQQTLILDLWALHEKVSGYIGGKAEFLPDRTTTSMVADITRISAYGFYVGEEVEGDWYDVLVGAKDSHTMKAIAAMNVLRGDHFERQTS